MNVRIPKEQDGDIARWVGPYALTHIGTFERHEAVTETFWAGKRLWKNGRICSVQNLIGHT